MMKKRIAIICFLFCIAVSAQMYQPIDTADIKERTAYIEVFKTRNENLAQRLKGNFKGKVGREVRNGILEFTEFFSEEIQDKNFLFHQPLQDYFESIFTEIVENNPNVNAKDMNLLVGKDNNINAYCMTDGTIVMNLGLLYWLENEDQLAGIMAHEMAHKILEHPLNTQLANIQEEIKEKERGTVRNIKRKKYNQHDAAFSLFKDKMYAKGAESRRLEMQADSLGYLLLKNTKYNSYQILDALELTIVYDTITPNGVKPETYKKYFNIPDFPFQEKWLNAEDFSVYDYSQYEEKLDRDSIASHPEAQDRLSRLKKIFPEIENSKTEVEPTETFKNWHKTSKMERVPTYYYTEQYGLALYNILYRLQRNEDEEYYLFWLGKVLDKFYESRKNYTLNRYMDRIEPEGQSSSYQQFINFVWNLNLSDIEKFRDYYLEE